MYLFLASKFKLINISRHVNSLSVSLSLWKNVHLFSKTVPSVISGTGGPRSGERPLWCYYSRLVVVTILLVLL